MRRSYFTSDTCEQLELYRRHIKLEVRFPVIEPIDGDVRKVLREAVSTLWSTTLERRLDIHLPSFLEYIAKDVSTLRQLLQIASQACSIETLTDRKIELVDQAYALAGATEHDDYDCAKPTEIHRLAEGEYLLIYNDHHDFGADAVVCLCADDFTVPADDYRSYRINALAGPRARRDCFLINRLLSSHPRTVVTRGYFSASPLIIHCRRPYADSDLAISQRLQIRDAYLDSLRLAFRCDARTVALPLICPRGSSSTLGKAYRTAVESVTTARSLGWRFKTVYLTGVNENDEFITPSVIPISLSGLSASL